MEIIYNEGKNEGKKGCGNISSNDAFFEYSSFSGVNTVNEANAERVDYFWLVKRNYKAFFLAKLGNLTEDWPGGSYLVMNITPIITGDLPLRGIGYKYNTWK